MSRNLKYLIITWRGEIEWGTLRCAKSTGNWTGHHTSVVKKPPPDDKFFELDRIFFVQRQCDSTILFGIDGLMEMCSVEGWVGDGWEVVWLGSRPKTIKGDRYPGVFFLPGRTCSLFLSPNSLLLNLRMKTNSNLTYIICTSCVLMLLLSRSGRNGTGSGWLRRLVTHHFFHEKIWILLSVSSGHRLTKDDGYFGWILVVVDGCGCDVICGGLSYTFIVSRPYK